MSLLCKLWMQSYTRLCRKPFPEVGRPQPTEKGNSRLLSEKTPSVKISQRALLCTRWDFSLWKLFGELPVNGWEKVPMLSKDGNTWELKQIAFKTSVTREMTQLKLHRSQICCLLSCEKKPSFQVLNSPGRLEPAHCGCAGCCPLGSQLRAPCRSLPCVATAPKPYEGGLRESPPFLFKSTCEYWH